MRIVLDTNVLISALIGAGGSADQVMQFVRKGEAELILSPFILDELTRVLTQTFALPPKAVEKALQRFRRLATIVRPTVTIDIINEKQADNRILELRCGWQSRLFDYWRQKTYPSFRFNSWDPYDHRSGISPEAPSPPLEYRSRFPNCTQDCIQTSDSITTIELGLKTHLCVTSVNKSSTLLQTKDNFT